MMLDLMTSVATDAGFQVVFHGPTAGDLAADTARAE
jgi:hypothetical protein